VDLNQDFSVNSVAQLCPNCGLCCDSTLFADVELRAGDAPERLVALGLAVRQKTKNKLAFSQPCACFDGRFCNIYAERPQRCRLFECGLLRRVNRGGMTASAALKRISQAKAQAEKVRERLRQSGQGVEQMALTHRYAEAMSAPVDLAVEHEAEKRGELMLAVNELMRMLERDFLS
jgi:Fe-S-cluster containining protein